MGDAFFTEPAKLLRPYAYREIALGAGILQAAGQGSADSFGERMLAASARKRGAAGEAAGDGVLLLLRRPDKGPRRARALQLLECVALDFERHGDGVFFILFIDRHQSDRHVGGSERGWGTVEGG